MSSVTATLTAVNQATGTLDLSEGQTATLLLDDTFTAGIIVLEELVGSSFWKERKRYTDLVSEVVRGPGKFRLRVLSTLGEGDSVDASLADITDVTQQWKDRDGNVIATLSEDGGIVVTGTVRIAATAVFQIGPDATANSFRLKISGTTLLVQRYDAGGTNDWTTQLTIPAA